MISTHQIQRLVNNQHDHQLASRVLANGRCHCSQLRDILLHPDRVRVVALGLALQRACELDYHPAASQTVADLANRLLAVQSSSGLFGEQDDLAGSAVALAGLMTWRRLRQETGAAFDGRYERAIQRGLDAIAEALTHHRPGCASAEDTVVVAAVLWQLGCCDEFKQRCCVERLLHSIAPRRVPIIDAGIWRYAAAQAA